MTNRVMRPGGGSSKNFCRGGITGTNGITTATRGVLSFECYDKRVTGEDTDDCLEKMIGVTND